jgi:hypothetical protein
MGTGIKQSVEITDGGDMYKVQVELDGLIETCFVSSMHLVDEKIKRLTDKIYELSRLAYLQNFDDV